MLKFLKPSMRPQATDIQAAATWGVAAGATAIWLVQQYVRTFCEGNSVLSYETQVIPFDWIRKTFFEKQQEEGK